MTTGFHRARIIGVLAASLLLCACSAVKLAYNNAHEAAYWWLDSYADFEDDQARQVREALRGVHQWHRAEELPKYAQLLQTLEQLAPGDITPAQACRMVDGVLDRLEAVATRAEPAVVALAISLTPAQLQHLERKYAKNNAEYRDDWVALAPAAMRAKRFKQLVERSEMIYGPLAEAQRSVLRAQLEQSVFDPRRTLAERQRRQQDALQTLRKLAGGAAPATQARDLMRGYLHRVRESPDAGWRKHQEELLQESCRSAAAVHNSTTPAQRDNAVRRLRAYQRDVRDLAAQT